MAVASSLRDTAERLRETLLARTNPIGIELIFGASSTLARQLALGAPIDILVSADAGITEELVDRNLLARDSVFEFARGRLVLIGRKGVFPPGVGIDVLASPAIERFALPSPSVPLGRYATSWLRSQGRLETLAGRIVRTENARATLATIDSGHVDLAIVYESDLRIARDARLLARIDPSEYPAIRYVAARTTFAPDCPAIRSALDIWRAPETRRRLEAAGFRAVNVGHPL